MQEWRNRSVLGTGREGLDRQAGGADRLGAIWRLSLAGI